MNATMQLLPRVLFPASPPLYCSASLLLPRVSSLRLGLRDSGADKSASAAGEPRGPAGLRPGPREGGCAPTALGDPEAEDWVERSAAPWPRLSSPAGLCERPLRECGSPSTEGGKAPRQPRAPASLVSGPQPGRSVRGNRSRGAGPGRTYCFVTLFSSRPVRFVPPAYNSLAGGRSAGLIFLRVKLNPLYGMVNVTARIVASVLLSLPSFPNRPPPPTTTPLLPYRQTTRRKSGGIHILQMGKQSWGQAAGLKEFLTIRSLSSALGLYGQCASKYEPFGTMSPCHRYLKPWVTCESKISSSVRSCSKP